MLQCVAVEDVAAMANDSANGVDASVVASDSEGAPVQAVTVGRGFLDSGREIRFGDDGNVAAIMDSDACAAASSDPQIDDLSTNTNVRGRNPSRKLKAAAPNEVALANNREAYRRAMKAVREEGHRSLPGVGSVPIVGPWSADLCADMPDDDENAIQAAIDAIACPAMRFLVKRGLASGLFDICGYGGDDYLVDTASMKDLISSGVDSFPGLNFDRVITNDDNLSVFHRAFSGAVDGQAVGVSRFHISIFSDVVSTMMMPHLSVLFSQVIKHVDTQQCLNIDTENPRTTSTISLSSSCSGSSQRYKFLNSGSDASVSISTSLLSQSYHHLYHIKLTLTCHSIHPQIQIYHRSTYEAATEYCLVAVGTGVGVGVELKSCADAGDLAKWSPPDSHGRIKKWGEDGCLNVAALSITVETCSDSTLQVWAAPPIINAADLGVNFDHSASTGERMDFDTYV